MHVLGVIPLYPPHSLVGAWVSTHECLAALAARGHQVAVVQRYGGHAPYELDGVQVLPRTALLGQQRADLIVSHLGDDGAGARHARALRVPDVRMIHGRVSGATQALRGATLVVANSHSLLAETRWPGTSLILPPPIWPDRYRTTPGDLITLVNPSIDKGGRVLEQLAAATPHRRYLAVTGGHGTQVRLRGPNVHTLRPTPNMAADVYSRTRVLLMPSARESYGRVALEAACSGIPTLAHPTPGLRESLGDAGIWAHREHLAQWIAHLDRLDDPDQWQQASTLARARADALNPSSDLERFADTLEQLVGERACV